MNIKVIFVFYKNGKPCNTTKTAYLTHLPRIGEAVEFDGVLHIVLGVTHNVESGVVGIRVSAC